MPLALGLGIGAAGLFAGGGALGGAFAAQQGTGGSSNNVIPSIDPQMDFALQASALASLGQSGFFNPQVLKNTGPIARLTNQINATTSDEKIKRRALQELQRLIERGSIGADGSIDDSLSERFGTYSDADGSERFPEELRGALARIGFSPSDLGQLIQDEQRFQESIAPLMNLGPVQSDIILNRLNAGRDVSSVAAGIFGDNPSPQQQLIRQQFERDRNRDINRAEETLLLQGQFGKFNPSAGLERIAELRSDVGVDAELASIERALLYAGGVNNLLQPGIASAQGQAGLSTGSSLNALGIAANQATAANQINASINQSNAAALGNGISAAGSAFGDALMAGTFLGQGGRTPGFEQSTLNDSINPTNAEFNRIVAGYER